MSTNIFETATRLKVRFASPVGRLTVEDLWTLPLTSTTGKANLNDVARTISKELKTQDEEDFVGTTTTDPTETLKLDIVKHIISVRKDENKAKEEARVTESQNALIKQLIAEKKNEELKGKSLEELEAMVK